MIRTLAVMTAGGEAPARPLLCRPAARPRPHPD